MQAEGAPPTKRLRAVARHGALDALAATWKMRGRTDKALSTPRVHFPYLHAVPPQEEDDFRRLLRDLAHTHTFVSYSEAVDKTLSGQIDKPYVAFSFDDGFASNVRTAAILEEFGAVGCFFVATGFIGVPTLPEARDFFGYSGGIDEHAMTWTDLENLKGRGHEIGNHTYSHRQISAITPDQAVEQIGRGAEMLRERLGGIEHFAWPFGRFSHFTAEAAAEVFAQGHVSCASAERGSHSGGVTPPESLCIRRDHVMTSWPLRHSRYFLASSALGSRAQGWPEGWEVPHVQA